MEENHPLDALPKEIKLNIFSRLPVESVLSCISVCRAWRSDLLQFHATNTTYFANLHLRNHYGQGVLVKQPHHKRFEHCRHGFDSKTMSFAGFEEHNTKNLWYLEYYEDDSKQPNYRIRKMNLRLPGDVCGIPIGSDNGLICLTVETKYNGICSFSPCEPVYVCNPITREFVTLPKIMIHEKESKICVRIVTGFGYHPFTNEYKVVRISYVKKPESHSIKGKVEVYTLGSGRGWRSVGETNYYLSPVGFSFGVCVNGALHWLCQKSTDIVVFDLADESFHLLGAPTKQNCRRRLFVARRCLCIEYHTYDFLDFWVLKKNKNEQEVISSSYQMNEQEQYYEYWSWNRELRVPRSTLCSAIRGDYVLYNGPLVFCLYNQGTKKPKRIMQFNDGFSYRITPHINSFVSLEAVGETNVKKLEAE